jgi:hypothetical protein
LKKTLKTGHFIQQIGPAKPDSDDLILNIEKEACGKSFATCLFNI